MSASRRQLKESLEASRGALRYRVDIIDYLDRSGYALVKQTMDDAREFAANQAQCRRIDRNLQEALATPIDKEILMGAPIYTVREIRDAAEIVAGLGHGAVAELLRSRANTIEHDQEAREKLNRAVFAIMNPASNWDHQDALVKRLFGQKVDRLVAAVKTHQAQ